MSHFLSSVFLREQSSKHLWALKPVPHCVEVIWGWGKGFWSPVILRSPQVPLPCGPSSVFFLGFHYSGSVWALFSWVFLPLQAGGRIPLWSCVIFAFFSREMVYPGWVEQWSIMVCVSCQMPCCSDSPQTRSSTESQFLKLWVEKAACVRNSYSIMVFRGHLILSNFHQHIWSTANHDSSALKMLVHSSPMFWSRVCDFSSFDRIWLSIGSNHLISML